MSIKLTITRNSSNQIHLIRLEMSDESIVELKSVLFRALNCWPDAPPDFKDLSDILEYGKPLQNYHTK